jgi:hypothetical protein
VRIEYTTTQGDELTLHRVESFRYVRAAIVGVMEVAILSIGSEELVVTEFTVSND